MRTRAAVTAAMLALFCLLAGQIGLAATPNAASAAPTGPAVGLALVPGGQGWWVAAGTDR